MIPLSSFVKRHSSQPYAVTSFDVGHVSKRFPDGAHTGLRVCVSRNKWSTMVIVNADHILHVQIELGFCVHSMYCSGWCSQ